MCFKKKHNMILSTLNATMNKKIKIAILRSYKNNMSHSYILGVFKQSKSLWSSSTHEQTTKVSVFDKELDRNL